MGYSTYGWGSTGVADSLLGIRWLYSDGSRPVAGHWQPVDCDSAYTLYKNDAAFRWPTWPGRMPCPWTWMHQPTIPLPCRTPCCKA